MFILGTPSSWRRVARRQRMNGRRRGVFVQLTPRELCSAGTSEVRGQTPVERRTRLSGKLK